MDFLKESLHLKSNLSAAAHLIHGSSEGRFTVTYCPGGLTREEIEGGEGVNTFWQSTALRSEALDAFHKLHEGVSD